MSLYDTSALYNQNMSAKQQERFLDLYRAVFGGYDITTIHDVVKDFGEQGKYF